MDDGLEPGRDDAGTDRPRPRLEPVEALRYE